MTTIGQRALTNSKVEHLSDHNLMHVIYDALGGVVPAISSNGFGLPTTTGRNAGDLHYERLSQRVYSLIAGAWVNSSGAVNTVQAGLPALIGRAKGDHAFDSTGLRDYVLTGTPGASDGDDFNRADTTAGSGSIGSTSGARAWVPSAGTSASSTQLPFINGSKMVQGLANNRGGWVVNTGSAAAGGASVSARMKAGASAADVNFFTLSLGVPQAGDPSDGSSIAGGWYVAIETHSSTPLVNLYKPDGNVCQYASQGLIWGGAESIYTLSISSDGLTGTVYKDGVALTGPSFGNPTSGSASTGTYAGFSIKVGATPTLVGYVDDWSVSLAGTLAWTVATPVGPSSTVGFGLPTTTGRSTGDLAYDRLGGREYTLVNGSWVSTSGPSSTVSGGLPGFASRVNGDFHFDSTALKEYVLTGAAAASTGDDFTRTDGAMGSTPSGTAWTTFSNFTTPFTIKSGVASPGTVANAGRVNSMLVVGSAAAGGSMQAALHRGANANTELRLCFGDIATASGGWELFIGSGADSTLLIPPTGSNGSGATGTGLAANETATYRVDVATNGLTAKAYKNNVLIISATSSAAPSGTYYGVNYQNASGGTLVETAYFDDISVTLGGTLAWTPTLAAPSSTVGFGIPVTTGRSTGDLHYDQQGLRSYELVNGAWTPTAGAVNSVAAGLPSFAGRVVGDHHFETGALKDYVLTGAAGGATGIDTFTRANASIIGSTTESGSYTYASPAAGTAPTITSNIVQMDRNSQYAAQLPLGSTVQSIQGDFTFGGAGGNYGILTLRSNGTTMYGVYLKPDTGGAVGVGVIVGCDARGVGGTVGSQLTSTVATDGTYQADITSAGLITVRRNGVVLGTFQTTNALVGTNVGFGGGSGFAGANTTFDNLVVLNPGSLAWTLSQPLSPSSTTGFGVPTTTGRNNGDLHYDRLATREYVLVNGSWVSSSGPSSTVLASGLPGFAGRLAGDLAFDQSVGKQYTLTGTPGGSDGDDFTRADGAIGSTPNGARAWSNGSQSPFVISSNTIVARSVGGLFLGLVNVGSPAGGGSIQMTVHQGVGNTDISRHSLIMGQNVTGTVSLGSTWRVDFDNSSTAGGGGAVTIRKPDGTAQTFGNPAPSLVLVPNETAVFRLDVSADGKTATVYKNNTAIVSSTSASVASSGTYCGIYVETGTAAATGTAYVDDFAVTLTGTLAWTLSQPVATSSTVGFGLPTTTGRAQGDLHFDRLSQREYVLTPGPVWTSTAGSASTVAAGVPAFAGRVAGDLAFDSTTGREYVLTGAAGTQIADDFNRSNTTTGLGTSSTGYVWSGSTSSQNIIVNNKASVPTSGAGAWQVYENVGTGAQTASSTSMTGYAATLVICCNSNSSGTSPNGYSVDIGFSGSSSQISLRRGSSTVGTPFTMTGGKTSASNFSISLTSTAAGLVRVYIDGVLRISYQDATPLTGQYAGFGNLTSNNSAPAFDDIVLQSDGNLAWLLAQSSAETIKHVAASTATLTVDDPITTGTTITRAVLSANCTITLPAPGTAGTTVGKSFTVVVVQAASGGPYTAAFTVPSGNILWGAAGAPTQSTTASAGDMYVFTDVGGGNLLGTYAQGYV